MSPNLCHESGCEQPALIICPSCPTLGHSARLCMTHGVNHSSLGHTAHPEWMPPPRMQTNDTIDKLLATFREGLGSVQPDDIKTIVSRFGELMVPVIAMGRQMNREAIFEAARTIDTLVVEHNWTRDEAIALVTALQDTGAQFLSGVLSGVPGVLGHILAN
jgi:hypothetical protein